MALVRGIQRANPLPQGGSALGRRGSVAAARRA